MAAPTIVSSVIKRTLNEPKQREKTTNLDPAVFFAALPTFQPVGGIQWILDNPLMAWPYLIIGTAISIFGTIGNMACIGSILLNKSLRHMRNSFLLNMAVADLFVTSFADPMSVLGMVLGKDFFDSRPGLCEVVATSCMAACVSALFSLGAISFHQCLYICYPEIASKIFRGLKSHLAMIAVFWVIGTLISLPPLVGWTHIIFDDKYLECIFNRLHSESYTSFYSGVVVATPLCIISASYVKIFRHVQASKKRIAQMNKDGSAKGSGAKQQSLRLLRTLIGIFMVFVVCWGPFAILIVVDREDRGHMALHLYILLLAHMHASMNPVVYLATNKHYRYGFKLFFAKVLPCLNIDTSIKQEGTDGGSSVTKVTTVTATA